SMAGSTSDGTRLDMAKAELMRSVRRLPDYAKFFVVFFSSTASLPSWQQSWLRARPKEFRAIANWIAKIEASGSTEPRGSFQRVLGLRPPPDVIFFLTDGEVVNMTADDVAKLNRIRRPAVINTIAFGTQESQELLEQIARDSGGTYSFVPVRPGR
ncbi:MAG: hypothetical protein VX527_09310, partial [Planctomycetota bacterium]|nr:hypothetical protein [Planctomycetota bacterium]